MAETAARAKVLCRVEFPAHLETSYNDACDVGMLRRWLWERYHTTLPGDVDVEVRPFDGDGWIAAIRETG